MTTVEIRPRYVRRALTKAKDRNETFKDRESYQKRIEERDRHPEVDNFIGVLAELAFARYADLPIDPEIYEGGDGGIDFQVLFRGEEATIDVKGRTGDLFTFWVKEKQLEADYYVLGQVRGPVDDFDAVEPEDLNTLEGWTVELIGTATREEFLDARRIKSDHGWWNRSILLEDLRSIPDPDDIGPID